MLCESPLEQLTVAALRDGVYWAFRTVEILTH